MSEAVERRDSWTIQAILQWTTEHFTKRGIDTPRLDAELVLAHCLGVERIYLYTHFDRPLSDEERAALRPLVKRRAAREPVAYILGEREFFSRAFTVTPDVLIPRPETEHLVETVLKWCEGRALTAPHLIDVGTGSGAIALTLACELPEAHCTACDISPAALAVARQNAERHGVSERVDFVESDLFGAIEVGSAFDVVVSNPPYVDTALRPGLEPEVRDYEPATALFADDDGLAVARRLCADAAQFTKPGGLFLLEFDDAQHDRVRGYLEAGPWTAIESIFDLQGLRRGLRAERE